ncbi:MAG: hypothetical protein ACRER2_06700 [Methylococcales bacterium]
MTTPYFSTNPSRINNSLNSSNAIFASEMPLSIWLAALALKFDHRVVSLTVAITSVQDSVNNDNAFNDREEAAVVFDPPTLFGRGIGGDRQAMAARRHSV